MQRECLCGVSSDHFGLSGEESRKAQPLEHIHGLLMSIQDMADRVKSNIADGKMASAISCVDSIIEKAKQVKAIIEEM